MYRQKIPLLSLNPTWFCQLLVSLHIASKSFRLAKGRGEMYRNPYLSGRYGSLGAGHSPDDDDNSNGPTEQRIENLASEETVIGDTDRHSVRPLPQLPPTQYTSGFVDAESFRADIGYSRFPNSPHMKLSVFSPKKASASSGAVAPEIGNFHVDAALPSRTNEQGGTAEPPAAAWQSTFRRDEAVNALIAETEAAMRQAHELLNTTATVPVGERAYDQHHPLPFLPAQPNEHVQTPVSPVTRDNSPPSAPPAEQPQAAISEVTRSEPGLQVTLPERNVDEYNKRAHVSFAQSAVSVQSSIGPDVLTVHLLSGDELSSVLAKRASRRSTITPKVAEQAVARQPPVADEPVKEQKSGRSRKGSKHRRRRDDDEKDTKRSNSSPPVVPISAVTELVSSIVALVNKGRSDSLPAAEAAPPSAGNRYQYVPLEPASQTLGEAPARQPSRVLPPPQVVVGQPPLFSQTTEPIRSPYFANAGSSSPAAALPQVLPSVLLPRVGINDATVGKVNPAGKSCADSLHSSSSGSRRDHYLHPTESWLSKGPELQGVHLHLRKAAASAAVATSSISTKDRISEFNRHAKDYLRLHKR